MLKGTIKKIVDDKAFGFIRESVKGIEYFFHRSTFDGHWADLVEDFNSGMVIEVEFETEKSDKGPRAANVSRLN